LCSPSRRQERRPAPSHRAIDNGVTPQELGEAITHLAFYVGWPNALSAVARAKEVLGKKQQ
jgi:4-carboxymuconolactone decarboxylase